MTKKCLQNNSHSVKGLENIKIRGILRSSKLTQLLYVLIYIPHIKNKKINVTII